MNGKSPTALRVLVFFATNNLSGPGKGLLQLIENTDPTAANFTVCNFRHPEQETFEFLEVFKARGVDIRLIMQRWALDPLMLKQALEIARVGNYDIVQSHGYKTHILAWFVAMKCNLPWVAISHGWTSENLKIRIYNWIERLMIKLPDSVIGVSPHLCSEAEEIRQGGRSRMILNAIDSRSDSIGVPREKLRKQLGVARDEYLLGVFGRLSFEKGQDIFIDAIQKMKHRDRVKAVILGEGNAYERLAEQAAKSGIEKRVLFQGYQPNIIDYYAAIDTYILPSRSEGLPNVVLEAQLHGCPVVAFDVGGVKELICDGTTGYLVPCEDATALAAKIDWAFENLSELRKVANAARESLFPKFSVENRCNEFVDEYNWLVEHADRGR